MLTVETHLAGRVYPGSRYELIQYMKSVGYNHVAGAHLHTNTGRTNMGTKDDLFVRKDVIYISPDSKNNAEKTEL